MAAIAIGLTLQQRWSGGDLLVWISADDATTTAHAARRLTADAGPFATSRWVQGGSWRPVDAEGNPVGEIAWSDLFNVIRDTPGVRKMGDARLDLTLNGLPADVRLNVREFPVLRTVTLVNGDTGELL